MTSTNAKSYFLHGTLIAIGLIAGTFSNQSNNLDSSNSNVSTPTANVAESPPLRAVHVSHGNQATDADQAIRTVSQSIDTQSQNPVAGRTS